MSLVSRLKKIFRGERRLGLVLGSGGARGLAHIGVIKVLEEAGIPLHCVVGASAGAFVGGLYCAGTSPAKLSELVGDLSIKEVARLLLPTRGPGGIVDGRRLTKLIEPYAGGRKIEDLSPVFACVATDLISGKRVVFKKGNLMEAIRASISIPGLFTPVICGDRILVDGGIVDPLPIRLAFELGANFALVVRVGRRYTREGGQAKGEAVPADVNDAEVGPGECVREFEERVAPPIIEIVLSTLSLYDHRLSELCLRGAGEHILIQPKMPGIEILDFHKGGQAVAAGEKAMRERLPELLGSRR